MKPSALTRLNITMQGAGIIGALVIVLSVLFGGRPTLGSVVVLAAGFIVACARLMTRGEGLRRRQAQLETWGAALERREVEQDLTDNYLRRREWVLTWAHQAPKHAATQTMMWRENR